MISLEKIAESPVYQRLEFLVKNLASGGRGKGKKVKGLCAFSVKPEGLAFAYGFWAGASFHLQVVDFIEMEDTTDWLATLEKCIRKYKLDGVDINWVLQPNEYKLLQMQDVNVPDEELRLAVRWRIKDLIDFSIEDATVDAFKIPPHGPGNRRKMLYVVVAKQRYLLESIDKMKEMKLNVVAIDVNYLALRNIAALFEGEKKGTVLLHMQPTQGEVLISRDNEVFLARNLDKGLNDLLETDEQQRFRVESLAMEVKRSYDYFITQMAQPEPGKFLLSPLQLTGTLVTESLQRVFEFPIELLDINKKVTTEQPVTGELQSVCLAAIGGAMRKESPNVEVTEPKKAESEISGP